MIDLLADGIVTGQSLATPWPLIAVFIAAFGKEFADYLANRLIKPDTFADMIKTVLWATVLFIGFRAKRAKQVSTARE